MYVIASDNRRISLVSSCFDCFACDTTEEDEFKNRQKARKSRENTRIITRITVSWIYKIK